MATKTYIRVSWRADKAQRVHNTDNTSFAGNSMLDPILGVSLYDYATVSKKMSSGTDAHDICETLGIETAVFIEASAIWIKRMQEDNTHEITQHFARYFREADLHPRLKTPRLTTVVEEDKKSDESGVIHYFRR